MTLDEMYIETAEYVSEEISKSGGAYTGDSLTIVTKFKNAINYVYKLIAKQYFPLEYSEAITLDANKQFDVTDLTKTLYRIRKIEDSSGFGMMWKMVPNEKVEVIRGSSGLSVTVYYSYVPVALSALSDTPVFPEGAVDHKVLCYYAAFQYFVIEGDTLSQDKSQYWLSLFNDAVSRINPDRGEPDLVRNDMWGVAR